MIFINTLLALSFICCYLLQFLSNGFEDYYLLSFLFVIACHGFEQRFLKCISLIFISFANVQHVELKCD
jgi:hypothetical protein